MLNSKVAPNELKQRQLHMESGWLKRAFLPFKGFIFYIEKHMEEGRQEAMINRTNQASQKTQRGEWGRQTYIQWMRNKPQNITQ